MFCFIWCVLSLVIYSFICRWLVLQSVGDWFVILNWRLIVTVTLIQSFLNTSTRLISVLQSLVHHVGALFGFLSLVINWFICRWLLLQSVVDWFVILYGRLMVMLIHSFLNTATRLISVLQSLVHHVGASFGFLSLVIIHSFVGDWCYNLIGLSYWTGDWWWCSSKASSTPLLD